MNTSNTKNRVIRGCLSLSLISCFSIILSAQTSTLTIGSETACADREVLIPVNASDILNLSAITLRIGFDTTKLQYINLVNIDPQLTGINFSLNTIPPQIGIAWSSLVPANFQQGKFFDIKFIFRGETCPVIFNPGCELTNFDLQVIPVTYNDGVVNEGNPVVNKQPRDTTVTTGRNVFFHVLAANTTEYSWKESSDNGSSWIELQDEGIYSGTHTDLLTLTQVPSSLDKHKYICSLVAGACTTNSSAASLQVDSLSSVMEYSKTKTLLIHNYPNPFIDQTNFVYTLPSAGMVTLSLYDGRGRMIWNTMEDQPAGENIIEGNLSSLKPGLYFYKLDLQNQNQRLYGSGKIQKQ